MIRTLSLVLVAIAGTGILGGATDKTASIEFSMDEPRIRMRGNGFSVGTCVYSPTDTEKPFYDRLDDLSLTTGFLTAAEVPFRVCLDPGHPSENNDGRELLNGVREVEINWAVAQALQKMLEAKGYAVVLTKSSLGEYVTNKRRAEIANEARADLMLRLHADSEGPAGFTLFYPRKQSQTGGLRGPSPAVIEASGRAAKLFHGAVVSELPASLKDNGIKGDEQTFIGEEQGALTGSIYSTVPVLLVEMCNLAKPADAKWISDPANQQALAKALLAGVAAVADSKVSR